MKKVMLTILDGFGLRDEIIGNAVVQAHKPCFNYLWSVIVLASAIVE